MRTSLAKVSSILLLPLVYVVALAVSTGAGIKAFFSGFFEEYSECMNAIKRDLLEIWNQGKVSEDSIQEDFWNAQ